MRNWENPVGPDPSETAEPDDLSEIMTTVYAAPGWAGDILKDPQKEYPYTYASPEEMEEQDPEETIRTCQSCGKDIPVSAVFCPFCGMPVKRAAQAQERNRIEPGMVCVYAPPELMGGMLKQEKTSLFDKLFHRKNKE